MNIPPSLDAFVKACIRLAAAGDHQAVASLLTELIEDHAAFASTIEPFDAPEPSPRGWVLGGEHVCYRNDELTVMVLDTLPGVRQPPHDHQMHAIIGVFSGCEDQRFFARNTNGVTKTSERALSAGEVMVLGERAIHAISAEQSAARAIHVYFGDIYNVDRSLFHPDTLEPHEYSADRYDEFCTVLDTSGRDPR